MNWIDQNSEAPDFEEPLLIVGQSSSNAAAALAKKAQPSKLAGMTAEEKKKYVEDL